MKELYQKYKNIILFVVIAIVVFIGYLFFFGGNKQSPTLVSERPQTEDGTQSVVGRELLTQLLKLRSITLDERVFADGAFRNLRDFGQELRPEPIGRPNPFAPLESGGSN